MLELKIVSPANGDKAPESYEVSIRVMHGDADYYETVTTGPFFTHELEDLEYLLQTLLRMQQAYPDGRGADDGYEEVEGYLDWFELGSVRTEPYLERKDIWIPSDVNGTVGTPVAVSIVYYDMDHIPFNVSYTLR